MKAWNLFLHAWDVTQWFYQTGYWFWIFYEWNWYEIDISKWYINWYKIDIIDISPWGFYLLNYILTLYHQKISEIFWIFQEKSISRKILNYVIQLIGHAEKYFMNHVNLNWISIVLSLFQLIWQQMEFRLVSYQSEKCNDKPNLVSFNKI